MIFFQQRSRKSHKEKRGLGIHQVSHQSITVNTGSRGNIPAPGKESIPPPRPYFPCQIQHPAGTGAKQPHPQETVKNGCSYCTSQCSMGNYSGTNAQSSHHSRAKAVCQRAPGNKSLVGPGDAWERSRIPANISSSFMKQKNPYALGCACL